MFTEHLIFAQSYIRALKSRKCNYTVIHAQEIINEIALLHVLKSWNRSTAHLSAGLMAYSEPPLPLASSLSRNKSGL